MDKEIFELVENLVPLIEKGDIVQIDSSGSLADGWDGCLAQVEEVKAWGVRAFVRVPMRGDAYIRLQNGWFSKVGKAENISQWGGEGD